MSRLLACLLTASMCTAPVAVTVSAEQPEAAASPLTTALAHASPLVAPVAVTLSWVDAQGNQQGDGRTLTAAGVRIGSDGAVVCSLEAIRFAAMGRRRGNEQTTAQLLRTSDGAIALGSRRGQLVLRDVQIDGQPAALTGYDAEAGIAVLSPAASGLVQSTLTDQASTLAVGDTVYLVGRLSTRFGSEPIIVERTIAATYTNQDSPDEPRYLVETVEAPGLQVAAVVTTEAQTIGVALTRNGGWGAGSHTSIMTGATLDAALATAAANLAAVPAPQPAAPSTPAPAPAGDSGVVGF